MSEDLKGYELALARGELTDSQKQDLALAFLETGADWDEAARTLDLPVELVREAAMDPELLQAVIATTNAALSIELVTRGYQRLMKIARKGHDREAIKAIRALAEFLGFKGGARAPSKSDDSDSSSASEDPLDAAIQVFEVGGAKDEE